MVYNEIVCASIERKDYLINSFAKSLEVDHSLELTRNLVQQFSKEPDKDQSFMRVDTGVSIINIIYPPHSPH